MSSINIQLGNARFQVTPQTPRVLLGRDPSCNVVCDDASISRRHAEVFLDQGQPFIRDLGSSNGTWVDGRILGPMPVPLQAGQRVFVGHVPLGVEWLHEGRAGATVMGEVPPELRAMMEAHKNRAVAPSYAQAATPAYAPPPAQYHTAPQQQVAVSPGAMFNPGMAAPPAQAPAQPQALVPGVAGSAALGVGGRAAPLPAEFAYRRQGNNENGVLLIALRQDTFSNNTQLDGFVEYTAMDNETIASIMVELVEVHKKGPSQGHTWDRVIVRQGPWQSRKGEVIPLPFQLRVPPGTSVSGRDVYWEIRGYVDIEWAYDVSANAPITMRNTDIERLRDSLGALDYRINELESQPLGQRFEGKFTPPAQLQSQLGIKDILLVVEYLGSNLKFDMEVEKTSWFKADKRHSVVFDLAQFRGAQLPQISGYLKQQIDMMMASK